jgi:hypothetical protein
MSEQIPLNYLARYLHASRILEDANKFRTAPPVRFAELTQEFGTPNSGLYTRSASQAGISNSVLRALTALSVLEHATQSGVYSFVEGDPPISQNLIECFVALHGRYLLIPYHSSALDFIYRCRGRSRPQRGASETKDAAHISFGDVSAFVELADDFLNNHHIWRFFDGALPSVLWLSFGRSFYHPWARSAQRTAVAWAYWNDLVEFFEFSINLGIVAGVGTVGSADTALLARLKSCFSPWYLYPNQMMELFEPWCEFLKGEDIRDESLLASDFDRVQRGDPLSRHGDGQKAQDEIVADPFSQFKATVETFTPTPQTGRTRPDVMEFLISWTEGYASNFN